MLEFEKLNYNDPKVWSLLSSGKTIGVFQLESHLGREWSSRMKPQNIKELADLISTIRPGCVSSDTKITVSEINSKERTKRFNRLKISDLYQYFLKTENEFSILSLEEKNGKFIKNIVKNVMYTGKKECYRILFTKYPKSFVSRNDIGNIWYDLECTDDHKLLTNKGWVELKNIVAGDRICVVRRKGGQKKRLETIANNHCPYGKRKPNIDGVKYFQTICYKNYIEQCVICGWNECSLDTHHISGNRHTDNSPENLCFLCPNHHRMVENGKITKEEILLKREALKLICTEDTEWATFLGKESVGIKDVYDITMNAPNHNFIAGNFIVHNCIEAKDENGMTMTELYCKRKHGELPSTPIHKCLEEILSDTYQIIVYQEQAMAIAHKIAGFSLEETDSSIRKGIGKKDAALLFSIRKQFVDGCSATSGLSEDEGNMIFDIIEKSSRYSFNLSHAVEYAYITYATAYEKVYKTQKFFCHWLSDCKYRVNGKVELRQLIHDAKNFSIPISSPDISHAQEDFYIHNNKIYYGLTNIKNIGLSAALHILCQRDGLPRNIKDYSWFEILSNFLNSLDKSSCIGLISSGAFDSICNIPRRKMLYDYNTWQEFTDREIKWIVGKKDSKPFESLEKATEELLNSGYINKKRVEKIENLLYLLKNPPHSLSDNDNWIIKTEEEVLGATISINRLTNTKLPDAICKDILKLAPKQKRTVGVEIQRIKEVLVKKKGNNAGRKMAFVGVNDGTQLDCIAFCDVWEEYGYMLYEGNCVAITLTPSDKGSFIIEKVYQL
jgi:hypothetical protein